MRARNPAAQLRDAFTSTRSSASVRCLPFSSNQITNLQPSRQRLHPQPRLPVMSWP
jgi:hypothetical protein